MDALSLIILAILTGVLLLFCWLVIRHFTDPRSSSSLTSFTASTALFLSLLCVLIIPIDVYVVSSDVDPNTGFQLNPDQTANRVNTLKIIYYVLWCSQLAFSFFFLPFAYFYFEEGGNDDFSSRTKILNALKYTIGFTFVMAALLIIGLFVQKNALRENGSFIDRLRATVSEGDIILTFTITCLTVLGLIGFISYTAYGMAYLPVSVFRSVPTVPSEGSLTEITQQIRRNSETIQYLRTGKRTTKDLHELNQIEQKQERLHILKEAQTKKPRWAIRIWNCSKPLRIILSIVLMIFSLLFIVTLLLSVIDAIVNSTCGFKCGFATYERKIVNPLNALLQFSSKVFPVDYIVFGGIVLFVFFCTVSAISSIGVRIFWIKLYSMRRKRTMQNGLLMGIWMTTLVVLALNIEVLTLAPEYSAFGTQKFIQRKEATVPSNVAPENLSFNETKIDYSSELVKCTIEEINRDHCVLSQIYRLIGSLLAGLPFFGTLFVIANCVFIAVFFLSLFYVIFIDKPSYED